MKAKEFVQEFKLLTANNPTDRAFVVNEEAINEFAYSNRLQPCDIELNIIDDSTIEARWITYAWDDDVDSLIEEIKRYSNKIAEKSELEEDVLLILRIRSKSSRYIKDNIDIGRKIGNEYIGLNDRGNELIAQHFEAKIVIKATKTSANKVDLIDISKCKVYTLDGMNIHWWYQATGKNYARAALFIESDGSYSINRDDLGSEARLISIGAKARGDGNTLWSGYHKEENIKCYKLAVDTQFKMDCYIDIDTLKDIKMVDKNLFELEK